MSPVSGLAIFGSALVNLKNGREARVLQLEEMNRNAKRWDADYAQKIAHFEFQKEEAAKTVVRRLAERQEDRENLAFRDKQQRAHKSLSAMLNVSPDALLHNPYADMHEGIDSLLIIFLRPENMPHTFHNDIEIAIGQAIKAYTTKGESYPIHFPTGITARGYTQGSAVATQLHSWDPTRPTLFLRIAESDDGNFDILADRYGFRFNGNKYEFREHIYFGKFPKDTKKLAQALALVTLATADEYYLQTYGKIPLLPYFVKELLNGEEENAKALMLQLLEAYHCWLMDILSEDFSLGLTASLNIADALCNLSDKNLLIQHLNFIEETFQPFLAKWEQLNMAMQNLYLEAGAEQDVERLNKLLSDGKKTLLLEEDDEEIDLDKL